MTNYTFKSNIDTLGQYENSLGFREKVKNSKVGRFIYSNDLEKFSLYHPQVEGEFFKEVKNNAKEVYSSLKGVSNRNTSSKKDVHKIIGTVAGVSASITTGAVTIPSLARTNELLYSVVTKDGRLWDIVNKRFLDSWEVIGYQLAKINPHFPFALWVIGSAAVGIGAGIAGYYISKKILGEDKHET